MCVSGVIIAEEEIKWKNSFICLWVKNYGHPACPFLFQNYLVPVSFYPIADSRSGSPPSRNQWTDSRVLKFFFPLFLFVIFSCWPQIIHSEIRRWRIKLFWWTSTQRVPIWLESKVSVETNRCSTFSLPLLGDLVEREKVFSSTFYRRCQLVISQSLVPVCGGIDRSSSDKLLDSSGFLLPLILCSFSLSPGRLLTPRLFSLSLSFSPATAQLSSVHPRSFHSENSSFLLLKRHF